MERNYNFLKTLLNTIPEPILTLEEPLLKRISQTNISILEAIQKEFGSTKTFEASVKVPKLTEDVINRVEESIKLISFDDQSCLTSPENPSQVSYTRGDTQK